MEGGGKTTYPICINIPYMRAIEYNSDEFLITGSKVEIVLLPANTNFAGDLFFFCINKV